jgi:hypothetical protein
MIDENYPSLVPHLQETSRSIDAIRTIDCGYPTGTSDDILILRGTRQYRRVLITRDYRTIKPREFPPCTHGGVVFVRISSSKEPVVARAFKNLSESNKRDCIVGHLTYLHEKDAVIFTHKEKIRVAWRGAGAKRKYEYTVEPHSPSDPFII